MITTLMICRGLWEIKENIYQAVALLPTCMRTILIGNQL